MRNRFIYSALIVLVTIVGYSTRYFRESIPDFIGTYGGDTFWALLFFLIFGFLFNQKSTLRIALISIVFAYGIEISQLYQAEWINNIRSTFLGSMILGHGFLWTDFICYTVGILFGAIGENIFLNQQNSKP